MTKNAWVTVFLGKTWSWTELWWQQKVFAIATTGKYSLLCCACREGEKCRGPCFGHVTLVIHPRMEEWCWWWVLPPSASPVLAGDEALVASSCACGSVCDVSCDALCCSCWEEAEHFLCFRAVGWNLEGKDWEGLKGMRAHSPLTPYIPRDVWAVALHVEGCCWKTDILLGISGS